MNPTPLLAALAAASLLAPSLRAQAPAPPAQMDVFVSTGDNHFAGSSLSIDSPGSIEAAFDFFREVTRARRIYWRGLEEAAWVETMHARPENPRYYSLWQWYLWLYANVKPDELAVKAAHARGQEIWGVSTMFDWGAPADTPTFGDYPFPFESKLKLAYPEWAPLNRHGTRRQGGPIEMAYPEARKALVDLHVSETLKAGYDGLTFLTYAENYSMRFQDEFGFGEPIVEAFKKLHRADLRTEPFKRFATRQDWLRLRGTYLTAFLRELRAALKPHGKKIGVILNGDDIHSPQMWNVPEMMQTAGSHYMDVETWVREGLVDSLTVYGNCARQAQMKHVDDLLFLCRQTGVEVSFMTSSPLDPSWHPFNAKGAKSILAVADEMQHLDRGFVPVPSAEGWPKAGLPARFRALEQVIAGKLKATPEELSPLLKSASLIERRMALLALAKTSTAEPAKVAPQIEAALRDPENGVRCMAALALGELRHPPTARALLASLEPHGNHMLVESVVIALRKLRPFPGDELAVTVKTHANAMVRMAAMRAILIQPRLEQVAFLRATMLDPDRFTAFAAAEALGNLRRSNAAILPLIGTLSTLDSSVAARAAVSLGVIAARHEKEIASLRPHMLSALKLAFERYGAGCLRDDADWGYRPVGNALRAMGTEGEAALRQLRDQRVDLKLAELAWRVLDLHQQPNTFSEVTEQENEVAHARRPPANSDAAKAAPAAPAAPGRDLHVDPAAGDDTQDGLAKPLKTITRAIRLAQPGDTIHLKPAVYPESADFSNKHGELGRLITLDGHGAILDGSEPVRDAEQVSPGLFRKTKLVPRMDDAMLGRWFFLWNGEMNHMGRTSKGTSAPLKKTDELKPREWTYVAAEQAFYFRLEPGQDFAAANLRYPARGNGVVMSLTGSHLRVRNLVVKHVYNDGFNIHGLARDTHFENITTIGSGDDGFSAHDDCHCEIDGYISIGNSTGLADVGESVTHYRNMFIADCLGTDVLVFGDGAHSFTGAVILSSAINPFAMDVSSGKGRRPCTLLLKDVLFRRLGPRADLRIGKGTQLALEQGTFIDAPLRNSGALSMQRTLMIGGSSLSVNGGTAVFHEGNSYRPSVEATALEAALHQVKKNARDLVSKVKAGAAGTIHTPKSLGVEEVLRARASLQTPGSN